MPTDPIQKVLEAKWAPATACRDVRRRKVEESYIGTKEEVSLPC
jgi:hypothetical protein